VESLLAAEKHALEMIADGASLNDILDHLCDSMDFHVAPSMTTILLMDPDGKRLWHRAGSRVPREWIPVISPLPVALEAGLCGTAAFLKERVIVPDVATDPNWPDRLRPIAIRNGIRAGWSEPILTKERQVLGTFALYAPESRVPSDADLALIKGAGRIALIAIERQRSQEALRNALDEIRESERALRKIIDTIPGFVCALSAEGQVEVLNRQTLEYFGKTVDELKNWATSDAVHPDDLPRVIQAWSHAVKTGEPYVMELRQRRTDGVYRWFQSRALPTRDPEGRITGWYMLLTDIDDRKRTEDALRVAERDLRTIFETIPGFAWRMSATGEVEIVSQQMLEYFGKTLEELKDWPSFLHPDDQARVVEYWRRTIETGQSYEIEHRLRRDDGTYRWFQGRGRPLKNAEGHTVCWHNLLTDIDERKRAEGALEKAYDEIRRLTDRLRDENVVLREQIDDVFNFEEIVGSSPALKGVLASIVQVAPTDSTVLISGETGTGKERIAHAIHNRSHRSGRAFVSVNCASIPTSLVASELFGHEKGAFTGAVQRRQGRFELAHGGTIFLDEIGDLPAETQLALLRVLQERTFERVGGNRVIPTDVRIIAATNRDLTAAIDSGAFRVDLFYRLNVFPIYVPPLRERKEDIPILIEYFLKRYADKAGKRISKIDKKALDLCESYDWPGNVRELQNIVERSVILCNGDTLRVEQTWLSTQSGTPRPGPGSLTKNLEDYERGIIEAALAESNGKVAGPDGAAARLGVPRSTLDARIKQLGIKRRTVR
jgi:formate hydrogenlyase transcriptional activator